jgi:hypothetical protein
MPPLPPWIRSIKRPLDRLVDIRRDFESLPDTEPGEELGARGGRRPHPILEMPEDDRPALSDEARPPRPSPRR